MAKKTKKSDQGTLAKAAQVVGDAAAKAADAAGAYVVEPAKKLLGIGKAATPAKRGGASKKMSSGIAKSVSKPKAKSAKAHGSNAARPGGAPRESSAASRGRARQATRARRSQGR